ncbi:MAG: hypothetical protein COX65_07650 [Elusimicrobia bacterium CG_4_10_14_0_2_um_filter_56_8]|nr:MAG: hypothetical protein COX65_07650 [Elusimicrobia bacterium CG_4_10_14_0_2_um_filter_56_8]
MPDSPFAVPDATSLNLKPACRPGGGRPAACFKIGAAGRMPEFFARAFSRLKSGSIPSSASGGVF